MGISTKNSLCQVHFGARRLAFKRVNLQCGRKGGKESVERGRGKWRMRKVKNNKKSQLIIYRVCKKAARERVTKNQGSAQEWKKGSIVKSAVSTKVLNHHSRLSKTGSLDWVQSVLEQNQSLRWFRVASDCCLPLGRPKSTGQ